MRVMRTMMMAGLGYGAWKAYQSYRASQPPKQTPRGGSF